jgi:hypothetical protein
MCTKTLYILFVSVSSRGSFLPASLKLPFLGDFFSVELDLDRTILRSRLIQCRLCKSADAGPAFLRAHAFWTGKDGVGWLFFWCQDLFSESEMIVMIFNYDSYLVRPLFSVDFSETGNKGLNGQNSSPFFVLFLNWKKKHICVWKFTVYNGTLLNIKSWLFCTVPNLDHNKFRSVVVRAILWCLR